MGGWYEWGDDTFSRHAWWYKLSKLDGLTSREIKNRTLEKCTFWIFTDFQVLAYWQKIEPGQFQKMCKKLHIGRTQQNKLDKLKLLYYLGRFHLGRAKRNLGWPAWEFPPFDSGSMELQTGRKYLVHVNYQWPESLYEQEPDLQPDRNLKALREDFEYYWKHYSDDEYNFPMQKMIRKAISDMQKKNRRNL